MTLKFLSLSGVILFFSILVFGCQQVDDEGKKHEKTNEEKFGINHPKIQYPPEDAVKNGDIVYLFGEISNLEKFENFIQNIHAETGDEIRITLYTIEGDPTFYNLHFDGKSIHYAYDPSQDRFGDFGADVQSTACSNLVSEIVEDGIEYHLEGCHDEIIGDTFHFLVTQN